VGYFKEMGILVDVDVDAEDEQLEIKGAADALVEIAGHERVVEIKSINKKGFSSLRKPKRPHLFQLNAYMYCLGINQGIVVYENKDSQELREFNVGLDPGIVAEFTRKIKQAQHLIRRIKPEEFGPEIPKQPSVPHVIQLPWESSGSRAKGIWGWFRAYLRSEIAV
jgi:CRISPR/Cas system-associated exonuclease Cas4 (RecB family)